MSEILQLVKSNLKLRYADKEVKLNPSQLRGLLSPFVNSLKYDGIPERSFETYTKLKSKTKLTEKEQEKLDGYEKIKANFSTTLRKAEKNILTEVADRYKYGIYETLTLPALERGIRYEQHSIDLFNSLEILKPKITKNNLLFEDSYLRGTMDYIDSEQIIEFKTAQTKSSFNKISRSKVKDEYILQLLAYAILAKHDNFNGRFSNIKEYYLVYCLPSYTDDDIMKEITKESNLFKKSLPPHHLDEKGRLLHADDKKEFLKICNQIYLNMNFDRISTDKRVKIFDFSEDVRELLGLKNLVAIENRLKMYVDYVKECMELYI